MKFFLAYFLIISLISVFVCCYDKRQAIKGKHRVSEKTLLYLCVFGGAVVMYLTMRIIRHKTQHNKFMVGIPVIILLQAVAIVLIFQKFF